MSLIIYRQIHPSETSSRVLSRVSPQTGETSPAAGQVSVVAYEGSSGFAEVLFAAGEVSSIMEEI